MLKRFGVQGVKVQEIVSLDDEILAFLPYACRHVSSSLCKSIKSDLLTSRPVYGLIFLFKWMEEDSEKQEQSCPEGVWFANQVRLSIKSLVVIADKERIDHKQRVCECCITEHCEQCSKP